MSTGEHHSNACIYDLNGSVSCRNFNLKICNSLKLFRLTDLQQHHTNNHSSTMGNSQAIPVKTSYHQVREHFADDFPGNLHIDFLAPSVTHYLFQFGPKMALRSPS